MSRRDRKTSSFIGGLMKLLLVLLIGVVALGGFRFISETLGSIPFEVVSVFFIVFLLVGMMVFAVHKSSSRLTDVDEYVGDPTTSPVYYEETTPKDFKSRIPGLICPDCGHKNPRDADFCIKCGRDLDVTDDVPRY